ncbi:hypothetical protein CJ030_MR6G013681 [Morella rubra]|uniref:Uncharacterized protein n=1 Tax=Morella rubra TaxID=262757 RepID=A0A6A1VAE9_9ROSI|nr:hypothetical protein CJ030_MR6G013681 [Morella rubra]
MTPVEVDPRHLHDHNSPNGEDTNDDHYSSNDDHYLPNNENTNDEDPPNITFRHSWLNVGIMLPPAWGRRSSPPNAPAATQFSREMMQKEPKLVVVGVWHQELRAQIVYGDWLRLWGLLDNSSSTSVLSQLRVHRLVW